MARIQRQMITMAEDFSQRWLAVNRQVLAFLLATTRDRIAAEDLLQETAVALLKADERYDPTQSFLGWAIGFAKQEARRWRRTRATTRQTPLGEDVCDQLAVLASDEAWADAQGRKAEALRECLAELRGRTRQVITGHYVEGLAQEVIATRLGMAISHLRVVLHRARQVLRACIERRLEQYP
jgi:RNA polymerase sigma-70 factor (ECF subfamily)